jgi:hypothetical protein
VLSERAGLARLVEPASKLDSLRVLEDAGIATPSGCLAGCGWEPGSLVPRPSYMKTTRILTSATTVLAALAAAACAHAAPARVSQPPVTGRLVLASCQVPRGSATLTLTDTTPTPRVTIEVGRYVAVTVPAWHWGTATHVQVTTRGLLRQVCTVVTRAHGRRTVLVALRSGRSHLGATVEPASNLMMPAWSGIVVVRSARG